MEEIIEIYKKCMSPDYIGQEISVKEIFEKSSKYKNKT